MDGFLVQAEKARLGGGCSDPNDPECLTASERDVMGYHDDREIPNYWAYARNFVLQDHMFEPNSSWSLPAHLFTVSLWSAQLRRRRPGLVHEQRRPPGRPARLRHRPAPRGPGPDVRLDGPDLPAAPRARLVALLRGQGQRAGLRRRRADHLPSGGAEREHPRDLEPAAVLHDRPRRQPAQEHRVGAALRDRGPRRHPARGELGDPVGGGQRAPAGAGQRRPVLCHRPGERGDVRPGLEVHRHLPDLGRLGRLLRPRRAADHRRERLRAAGAGHRHQPVRPARTRRPPGAQLRRLRQVHRGPVPARAAAGPDQRRPAGPAAGRPGERRAARRPAGRLRLQQAAAPSAPAAVHPTTDLVGTEVSSRSELSLVQHVLSQQSSTAVTSPRSSGRRPGRCRPPSARHPGR